MPYRRIAVLAAVLVLAVGLLPAAWTPAAAGAPGEEAPGASTTEPATPLEGEDIIPLPNSGREPSEPGDRGGALQVLVLVLIVGGLAAIGGLAVRESRRNRAR